MIGIDSGVIWVYSNSERTLSQGKKALFNAKTQRCKEVLLGRRDCLERSWIAVSSIAFFDFMNRN